MMQRRGFIRAFGTAAAATHAAARANGGWQDRDRAIVRVDRPRGAARYPVPQRREAVARSRQREGRRQRRGKSSSSRSTTAMSPIAASLNTEKLISQEAFALFGYIGTPTCSGGAADCHRGEGAVPVSVHRRAGPARTVQPLCVPRARFVLGRDGEDRQPAARRRHAEDRRLLSERRPTARPGSPACSVRCRTAERAGGARHRRAQYGRRGCVGAGDSCRATPEAIVQISAYKSCAAFIRDARKAGFGGHVLNVSFVGTQALATNSAATRAASSSAR